MSQEDWDSKKLWLLVKPVLRKYEEDDGVVIFDDSIEEKPYTQENDLICWHHDHSKNRAVKGMNIMNCVYNVGEISLPIGFDLIKKPIKFCELKTKKQKRKSTITKNEMLRNHLKVIKKHKLKYKYVVTL